MFCLPQKTLNVDRRVICLHSVPAVAIFTSGFERIFKHQSPNMKKILTGTLLLLSYATQSQVYSSQQPLVHTYSIVARDEKTGEMAVGVQSHWFAVGISVPWAEAGVGAVATQSFVDKSYGPKALALLKSGLTSQQALDSLTKADPGRDVRQVAIIDTKGNVAAHTGKNCIQVAKHIKGTNFSVQSNMMLGDKVCEYMVSSFEQSTGKPLAERVLLALEAAQKAGWRYTRHASGCYCSGSRENNRKLEQQIC